MGTGTYGAASLWQHYVGNENLESLYPKKIFLLRWNIFLCHKQSYSLWKSPVWLFPVHFAILGSHAFIGVVSYHALDKKNNHNVFLFIFTALWKTSFCMLRNLKNTSHYISTRYRWYSKNVRSLFDRSYFYEMKVVVNFFRWGGSAPPNPTGWGCAPDPAFLHWHRELNG